MATSEVQICNMALNRIGCDQRIAALDEASTEAATCSVWFDICRDYVLEDMDWGFARARVTLAETTETPPDGWTYNYGYPSGAIVVRALDYRAAVTVPAQRIPFEIVTNSGTSRGILANISPAVAIYTRRITDVSQFPAAFTDALAWRLATELAMPIAKSQALRDAVSRYYLMALNMAEARSLNEAQEAPEPESEFIQVRGLSNEYDTINNRLR